MKLDNLEKAFFWLFTEATRHELMEYAPEDIDFEAAEQELNAAKKAADAQWISVKDRLPELMDYVLTYSPSFALPITTQLYGRQECFGGDAIDGFQVREGKITYWMPLPNPPEVKK